MYICKKCGNTTHFTETNLIETHLVFNKETHELVSSEDELIRCSDITCDKCGAMSEDDDIESLDADMKIFEVCQEIDCELVKLEYVTAVDKAGAVLRYLNNHTIHDCDKIAVCECVTRRK